MYITWSIHDDKRQWNHFNRLEWLDRNETREFSGYYKNDKHTMTGPKFPSINFILSDIVLLVYKIFSQSYFELFLIQQYQTNAKFPAKFSMQWTNMSKAMNWKSNSVRYHLRRMKTTEKKTCRYKNRAWNIYPIVLLPIRSYSNVAGRNGLLFVCARGACLLCALVFS